MKGRKDQKVAVWEMMGDIRYEVGSGHEGMRIYVERAVEGKKKYPKLSGCHQKGVRGFGGLGWVRAFAAAFGAFGAFGRANGIGRALTGHQGAQEHRLRTSH